MTSIDSAPVELLAGDLEAAERKLRKDYGTLEQMGERNCISTTAGMLAEVLYRQGRYGEAAERVEVCRDLAPPDDVASQFLWRCVRAKLLARDEQHTEADRIINEALRLIGDSDWLDWQGEGFLDLAEIRRLAGRTAEASEALARASDCFAAKGNLVSARRAEVIGPELLAASPGPAS